jgi:hypothetical protein
MTTGRATALAAGVVGAFALGVAVGPSITNRDISEHAAPAVQVETERSSTAAKPRAMVRPSTRTSAAKAPAAKPAVFVEASEPELHSRLKPVLNRGTRMEVAAEGFKDAEQFATVAHAARNTQVPFMVLKHRVLNEKQSLADAIEASKPDVDAKAEVTRARHAARADVEAIADSTSN